MEEYINEKFIDIILEEYPNVADDVLFREEENYQDYIINAVTIAQFPGIRIELVVIRDEHDER